MLYKNDFPIYETYPELVYLDHAATSHKPKLVLDGIYDYYTKSNGSPHRGAHDLSIKSTTLYDNGRAVIKDFIHAPKDSEVVFVRNATEGLNMVAESFEPLKSKVGNIVIAITNHHSNILPFQNTVHELRYMYCDDEGYILKEELDKIDDETILVSVPYISNGIGVKHDIKTIIDKTHKVGATFLLDAAQAVGHEYVNVTQLDVDLMVFSGHKMYAPQGIGVVYGKRDILNIFRPFLTGGDMIEYVTEQSSTYAPVPERLEAGTQNVAGVVGLIKAIEYINEVGIEEIEKLERQITTYAYEQLSKLDFLDIYGPKKDRGALITFNVKDVHPHDVSSILDTHHIAIRAGHHCCQPLMQFMGLNSTCRASFNFLNTKKDVDLLIKGLEAVKAVFYE